VKLISAGRKLCAIFEVGSKDGEKVVVS
jgi:hypothetical protein